MEDQPALEHRCVTEAGRHASEEAVEHEHLSCTSERDTVRGSVPQALLERILEAQRRGVRSRGHAASPP
jgi:hypothetical protein